MEIELLNFQFLLDLALYNKFIQITTVFFHCFLFSGKAICQDSCLSDKTLPDLVDLLDLVRIHTSVDADPFLSPSADPSDSKRDHIIFQFIRFTSGDIRHPTAEITEYTLITESLNDHLKCRTEIFHKRIHKD